MNWQESRRRGRHREDSPATKDQEHGIHVVMLISDNERTAGRLTDGGLVLTRCDRRRALTERKVIRRLRKGKAVVMGRWIK